MPGLLAAFPMEAIREQNEFRIVFGGEVEAVRLLCKRDGPTKDTAECVVPIDMTKIR